MLTSHNIDILIETKKTDFILSYMPTSIFLKLLWSVEISHKVDNPFVTFKLLKIICCL